MWRKKIHIQLFLRFITLRQSGEKIANKLTDIVYEKIIRS